MKSRMDMNKDALLSGKSTTFHRMTRRDALRVITATAGTLVAGSVLDACGSTTSSSSGGPVTLQFWDTFTTAEINLLHTLGAEYTKLNPNVKINFYEIPYAQRPTKIPSAVQTNSLPDIIRADYPYQWYLSTQNKLAFLENDLKGWDMRTAIYDSVWQQTSYQGHIIGVPQDKFTDVFCYNQDKFDRDGIKQFPTTWAELIEACQKMTHGDEYGLAFYPDTGQLFADFLLEGGGKLVDSNMSPTFNQDPGVAALQMIVDLVKKYKVTPPGVTGWQYANSDDALRSGKVGMAEFGSWIIGNYQEAKVPWKLGIGAMPKGPAGNGLISATTMYMVMNTSPHQQEAINLLKWLVSRQNALRWAKTLNHEPIDKYTAADPYFATPLFKPFETSLPYASSMPATPAYNAVNQAITQAIQQAILGQKTPKAALNDAATTAKSALQG
ncbi:MAG TPA: sugar ABC transporter substrate-binding protein [Ktedonobacteraceae bacterium]